MTTNSDHPQVDAVILAAGKGTRMQSDLPKVMHEVQGRPMVHWVVDACRDAGAERIVVVVGHMADLVRKSFDGVPGVSFVEQLEQLGTGHAVDQARPVFADTPERDVLVLCGDGPLIRPETLELLHRRHVETGAAATLATAVLEDASGYGRIQRTADGGFDRIVEQKDASPEQLELREVNPSYYIFRADALFDRLGRLGNGNASGEYYITDVFELMLKRNLPVEVIDAVPAEDILSINTLEHLAQVDAIYRSRQSAAAN